MHLRRLLRDALILGSHYSSKAFSKKSGARVIVIHDVKDAFKFREKMVWLTEHYQMVKLDILLHHTPTEKPPLALTFDDGYLCWYEKAAPILESLNIPATFFVCSGLVGLRGEKARQFVRLRAGRGQDLKPLTKDQLIYLANNPLFEIGSHTKNHTDLGKETEREKLTSEVGGDRMQLEDWIGRPIRWFAYPFGMRSNISHRAKAYVESLGFEGAFTIIPGFIRPLSDRSMLYRDSLDVTDSASLWRAWLNGSYDRVYHWKERWITDSRL